jgi:hypothetical protein
MPSSKNHRRASIVLAFALVTLAGAAQARVTKIVIDSTTPLVGQDNPYEQVRGRAFTTRPG